MRMKMHIVVFALLLVVGSVSLASAFDSALTSTLTGDQLLLSCFMTQGQEPNTFSYTLTNPGSNTNLHISGFVLTFPGVPANDFVVTQTPAGWVGKVVAIQHKIDWQWDTGVLSPNPADQLDPGESFQFQFTTALQPATPMSGLASAVGEFGFSGFSCGPAAPFIPEPTSVILGLMGLGGVIGAARLRRK